MYQLLEWKEGIFKKYSSKELSKDYVEQIIDDFIERVYIGILTSNEGIKHHWISELTELMKEIEEKTRTFGIFKELLLKKSIFKDLTVTLDPLIIERYGSNFSIRIKHEIDDLSENGKIDESGKYITRTFPGEIKINVIKNDIDIQKEIRIKSDKSIKLPEQDPYIVTIIVKSLFKKRYYSDVPISINHNIDIFSEKGRTDTQGKYSTEIFSGNMKIIATIDNNDYTKNVVLKSDKVVKIYPKFF